MIGKMSRLKKLAISAVQVNDFSFLTTCTALESLEISACGVIDCAFLKNLVNLKSLSLLCCPKLLHLEDIRKLFRLTRLSLEDSEISDASIFLDCRIKEVRIYQLLITRAPAAVQILYFLEVVKILRHPAKGLGSVNKQNRVDCYFIKFHVVYLLNLKKSFAGKTGYRGRCAD